MKKLHSTILLPLLLCMFGLEMVSCNQTSFTRQAILTVSDNTITISNGNRQFYNLHAKTGNINITKEIETDQKTPLLNIIKPNDETCYDIAYLLAQSNGNIKINLNIEGVLDTTINYHLEIKDALQLSTNVLEGNCAVLSGCFDSINVESDIIKWLFRKNIKNVSDETINNMRLYLQELNRTSYNEFTTRDTIPIITSFRGIDYKVSSDLVADNYYLFACKTEKEIEDFVEEKVSLKFEGAIQSLNQNISCCCGDSTSGTLCIFLVGIDNDWNYRIAPIGLVCIDNIKPESVFTRRHGIRLPSSRPTIDTMSNDLVFNKNNIVVKMPNQVPSITGYVSLGTRDWGGNGISANVNFSVSFDGDVKSLSIERSGNLAKWVGKETFVLDLQGKSSPQIFAYKLHLEDGDNYVPVKITDLRGNETEFMFNVACTMTRSNSPEINIDNDIDLNIW